jgi:hypothetical protein
METINTIEEYNKILNTTLSHNFEEQIEIINHGTQLSIIGIWNEYKLYFENENKTDLTKDIITEENMITQ